MNQGQLPPLITTPINSNLPDPVMLARQIDGIREVVLRMRTSQSATVDSLIRQKLQNVLEH